LPPSNSSDDRWADLTSEFSAFCESLLAVRAEFLVVGAYAVALHGAPRFTGDFDILVRPSLENGERVLNAIAGFGFPTSPLDPGDFLNPATLIEMGVPPLQIHLMTSISGVGWDEAWAGRSSVRLGSQDVAVIGRRELLRNKRAAGRAKDLADVEALEGDSET
jgi:hypothetical protein